MVGSFGEAEVVSLPLSGGTSELLAEGVSGAQGMPAAPGSNFGATVALGDIDGDGRIDVVVGDAGENASAGKVQVFHNGPEGFVDLSNQVTDEVLVRPASAPGSFIVGVRLGEGLATTQLGAHPGRSAILAATVRDDYSGFPIRNGIVWMFRDPVLIFADGFESGDSTAW